MLLMAAMLFTVAIVSCKEDKEDPIPPPDVAALNASITAATTLKNATTEGKNDGQFPVGSKATLDAAIVAAQAVVDNEASTQAQVDAAKVSLDAAITAYQNAVITPIAVEALVAHWSFDEGTGTTAGDASENEFDGSFVAGPMWPVAGGDPIGGGMPEWAEDRTGAANKAIYFGETGGSIEVPYNTALNPVDAITVSAWVKSEVIKPGNRFLGLQSWVGYKYELQEGNYPFFSVGHGSDATYDYDAIVALPNETWHHVAVTYSAADGKMTFYVDGELTNTDEGLGDEARSIADKPYNLVIGQDFPTDKYSLGDGAGFGDPESEDYRVIPLAWGGHFQGSIDELRIYNIALTESQIGSLYDREKP